MGGLIHTPELKSRVIELKTLDRKCTQSVIAQAASKEFDVRISKQHVGRIPKEALEHGPIDPRQTGSKLTLQVKTSFIDLSEELGEVAEASVPPPISPNQLPKWPKLEERLELWMAEVGSAHAVISDVPAWIMQTIRAHQHTGLIFERHITNCTCHAARGGSFGNHTQGRGRKASTRNGTVRLHWWFGLVEGIHKADEC